MAIDVRNPRYRVFCGACKATTGALFVGIFEVLCAITFLAFAIVFQTQDEDDNRRYANIAAGLFYTLAVILFIVASLLLAALAFKNGCLFITYMIKCWSFLAVLSIMVIMGILFIAAVGAGAFALSTVEKSSKDRGQHHDAREAFVKLTKFATVVVVIIALYAILQIWFFLITLAAHRAVRDDLSGRGGVVLSSQCPPNATATVTHTMDGNYGAVKQHTYSPPATHYPAATSQAYTAMSMTDRYEPPPPYAPPSAPIEP